MAIPRFNDDLDVIAKLADRPNDTNGMTAAQLKAKFDESGKTVQDYVNDTLLPYLESDSAASNMGIEAITGVTADNVQTALEQIAAKALSNYEKPSGGIPKSDLASAVQTSLGKADSAYQKPGAGIPKTDLAAAVQTSLGLADTALQTAPEEVYWATYGTTTSAEIEAAYQAGKVVKMNYSALLGAEHIYSMTLRFGATYHVFISDIGASRLEISCNSDTWGLPVKYDLSNATPQALGTASAGSSTDYSRSDHVHAMPSASDVGAIEAPATGTAGQVLKKTASGVEWANESGGGGSSPYTSNPAALGTASPGSSDNYARGDHVHPKPSAADLGITVPEAATATPKDPGTAAVGTSTKYAREDHVHKQQVVPVVGSSNPEPLGTASPGVSLNYSAADHVHPKPSAADLGITVPEAATAAPSDPASSASVGTSTKYARADHVHKQQTVPSAYTSTPAALGTASAGSSTKYAKGDHVHAMPTAANVGAIAAPSSPSVGDFLVYTSNGWAAQSLSTWQGGSF